MRQRGVLASASPKTILLIGPQSRPDRERTAAISHLSGAKWRYRKKPRRPVARRYFGNAPDTCSGCRSRRRHRHAAGPHPQGAPLLRAGLPADRDVSHAGRLAVLGLSRGVRVGRRGLDLRPDRLLPRHLQADRVLQFRAAHLGSGGREPRAGLRPDLHLHGRRHGEKRDRQRSPLLRPGALEARAGLAGAGRHHHGHHPCRHDRHHRRLGDHDDGAGAAHHDAAGLQPCAGLRHHCGGGNARNSNPAEHHAHHHGRSARRVGRPPVFGRTGSRPDARGALPASSSSSWRRSGRG